jgi:hypothetical protein
MIYPLMYLEEVMFNLEIHLEEVHLEEIHLEDHHSIHMSNDLDG